MIPVMQTTFGYGKGNCQPACVASILEINLEDVPDWRDGAWMLKYEAWLGRHGYGLIHLFWSFDGENTNGEWPKELGIHGDGYYLASGLSPRAGRDGNSDKMLHACVYQGGELAHDPHPEGGGLLDVRSWEMFVPCETWKGTKGIGDICTCGATIIDKTCPRHS